MQCSKETLVRLFYNVSSSFLLLFLFFYFTSVLLAKIFHFCGSPIFQRAQDGYDFTMFSDDEEEEEEEKVNGYFENECVERDDHHLVAGVIHGGEGLHFLPTRIPQEDQFFGDEGESYHEPVYEKEEEEEFSTPPSESKVEREEDVEEEILKRDTDPAPNSNTNNCGVTSQISMHLNKSGLVTGDEIHDEKCGDKGKEKEKVQGNFTRDENFLIFAPPKLESKKFQGKEHIIDEEEIFGDSCTVGSTSKSSSEWRSSINCSGTEDPFSSSSRRSCPKWESYTVFQKYDEEMLFLDRISAQKLHETEMCFKLHNQFPESLRSIQACPRSISERIVHKLATRNKSSSDSRQNPYQELEAAYVAQICLTWEALNWNYKYFQRLRASRRQSDPGCPAYIAQQFQQFQVLLQRYNENEPYEHGRRPEIYAKMRSLAPKLLQVPEYRDSNDEEKEENIVSRISSDSFLLIMEESIRTLMNFLKADRESHCQVLADIFKKKRRVSVDPTRFLLLKKENKKKKLKIKDLRRTRKCLRKRRLKEEEEMEILMALIDIKVVSRVLRMADLSEEQLHWCEDKMGKVRVSDGKLRRDSSPLFFPSH